MQTFSRLLGLVIYLTILSLELTSGRHGLQVRLIRISSLEMFFILIRINTLLVFFLSQLRSLAAVVHPLPCVVTN